MKRLASVLAFVTVVASGCSNPGLPAGGAASNSSGIAPNRIAHATIAITGTYTTGISANASIQAMSNAGDGRVWFIEFNDNNLGAITTTGTVAQYPTAAGAQPDAITMRATRMWSGGFGGSVISSTFGGLQKTYPVPGMHMGDIVVGPDNNLWFADYGNNKIGRVTASGTVTEFALPAKAQPIGIAVGKDGHFWITDGGRQKIIEMSALGKVLRSFGKGLTPGESLEYIAAAPDGNLYFAESANNSTIDDRIGRITTAGTIDEIGTLAPDSYPDRLTVGKDENVYFTEYDRKRLGKIVTSTGAVTEIRLPFANDSGTAGIVSGPDGRLWLGGSSTIYAVSY